MGESGAVERSGSDDGGDAVRGDAAAAGRRTTRSRGRRVARLVAAQLELAAAGRCATSVLVIDVGAVSSFEPGALDRTPDSAACHAITVCLSGCGGRAHLLPLRHQLAQFRTFPTAEAAARTLTGHGLYPDTDPDDEHPARDSTPTAASWCRARRGRRPRPGRRRRKRSSSRTRASLRDAG